MIVADPRGNVTLASPYHPAYPGAPTNKISVQYAVIAVAMRVGLGYDFGTSLKNEDPVFMQWIPPEIVRRPFPQAMEMILKPVNLSCSVLNGKIVLDGRS